LVRRAAGQWGNRESGDSGRIDNPQLSVAPFSSRGRQHKTDVYFPQRRENVRGEAKAFDVHQNVGRVVRNAIKKIGGKLPENEKVEPPITEVAKRLARKVPKQLTKPF